MTLPQAYWLVHNKMLWGRKNLFLPGPKGTVAIAQIIYTIMYNPTWRLLINVYLALLYTFSNAVYGKSQSLTVILSLVISDNA